MNRILLTSCLTFLVAFPVHADQLKSKPVAVPFELLTTGHMAVMVKVNGKGPYRLVFDTGAPAMLVNNKIAKEAGLLKNVRRPAFTVFGGAGQVKIEKLEVGDLTAENVAAVVMDHPLVDAMSRQHGPIEGIVGLPFFGRYKMTMDYQAKQLTFEPNGHEPADAMQAMSVAFTALLTRDKPAPKVLGATGQWGMTVAKESGNDEPGVTVKKVLPAGPAAVAGLQAGDRLLTLDGRWTDTVADCFAAAALVKPGTAVKVTIRRDGKEMERTVKPSAGL